MTEFILKKSDRGSEFIAFSETENQMVDSKNVLILVTFDREKLGLVDGTGPLLFMRVGEVESGLYTRFRSNTWYQTKDYGTEALRIYVRDYEEHVAVWQWLEKRINPLAITIATVLSSIITFIGVWLNASSANSRQTDQIMKLQSGINELKVIVSSKAVH